MQITLIGTGLMGKPMAERLLGSGHDVVVYNRTPEKAKPLEALGATIAPTATHAIQASPLTIFMVTDAAAIRDIVFPPRGKPNLQGRTILQMGTIAPGESVALAQEVRVGIGDYLEAPVLGSIAEVRAGQLIVMVGGSAPQWDRWVDLLKCFGPEPLLVGPVGHAAGLKLALNQLIASHIAAFSLSLSLIQRLGVDVEVFLKVLRPSPLAAPMFEKKLPRLLDRNYAQPNFPTAHLLKDVNLFLHAAEAANLETSALKGIRSLLEKTLEKGLGEMDYSSLFETVNPRNS